MSIPLSQAANQFAVELFQCYLSRHGDKYRNLLLCPYLIYHSLAMMLVGAKGETAEQLTKLLRISKQTAASKEPSSSSSSSSSPTSMRKSSSQTTACENNQFTDMGLKLSQMSIRSPNGSLSSSSTTISSNSSLALPMGRPSGHSKLAAAASTEPKQRSKSKKNNSKETSLPRRSSAKEQTLTSKSRKLTPDGLDEARHRTFLMLSEQLIHGNHEFIHLASFIYLDKGTKRTERFKNILRDYYETKPKKIDFNNVDSMVKTINEDVARTTENIYSDILSRPEAQKLEKSYMLLVNAVFFRGFWLSNFTDVKKGTFFRSSAKELQKQQVSVNSSPQSQSSSPSNQQQKQTKQQPTTEYIVNMMSKLDYLPVVNDDLLDARIVKMPFEASDLQMLLILPNDKSSDSSYLCDKISATKINHIIKAFDQSKNKTVRVSMPIFCIDSGKISIQSTLVTMGASSLFDKSKADMSGLCENKSVWLDKILHRCFIICDNRGAITSSSFEKARRRHARFETSGISTGRSGVDEFVADHPFMYIIMDSVTKTIFMIGLYTDPSETLEVIHENQLSPEEAHLIYTEGVYKT